MALSPKMELRTSQSLVMTPQLQQAIKLLQLSNLELAEFVEQELESNPVLERDEGEERSVAGDEGPDADADLDGSEPVLDPEDSVAVEIDRVDLSSSDGIDGKDAPLDTDYENVFTPDSGSDVGAVEAMEQSAWSEIRGAGGSFEADQGAFGDASAGHGLTLKEHLASQMNVTIESAVERIIGAHLIECLDERGYLVEEIGDIADKLGIEPEQVEAVLYQLQLLEPAGIGARDLAECWALQLKEIDRLDPAMQTFLDNLDLLAQHDLQKLSRICQVDGEDIAEMRAEIRALNPKPGLAYDYEVAQPIVPDVFVRRGPDGSWHVELNTGTLPKVLINSRYTNLVNGRGSTRDERAYVTECLNNANWLVKSLDQRARTILRVASEIVRQQETFLNHGVRFLKPLNLRLIAEAIDMHESTVSRVTSNKYMATPRGIFELKYFFTSAIASAAGGDAHSAEAVKHRICELIDAESVQSVLSDDRLVELLRQSGMDIARRTVAKYREAMRIPSSVRRRRMKRLVV